MTQELLERTVRDWVEGNPARATQELDRLAGPGGLNAAHSSDELTAALFRIAAGLHVAATRVW